MNRPDTSSITGRQFDLIVIGGGINGAAIARDAALRGLSVLLLEKQDFASGTTSWSTRLIHGGLRYLEHREFGLVRESLRERERLLHNAPHLVKPLPLHIPIYKRSKRGPLTIRAGMTAYDLLSFNKSLPRHRMLSREQALDALPGLDPDGLKGAAMYFDAQATFPERLVIENLIDATAQGALALNYARVDEILSDGFVTKGVSFTDLMTGASHEVVARAVLNVAGPWVDQVLKHGGTANAEKPLMGGAKGTHCFVRLTAGISIPPIYCEARSDGRAFFVLPWNGLLMIGTTDTRFAGDLDNVVATPDEIAYLLSEARILLPGAGISPDDLLFTYAGVRPLPSTDERSESGITRRHFVVDHAPRRCGLFSVVGGKLTTHRSLAEHAVDDVCDYLGVTARSETADRALPGSGNGPGNELQADGETLARLKAIYGSRSTEITKIAAGEPDLLTPLTPASPAIGAEVIFAFEQEMATSLSDILLRRTMLAYSLDMGLAAAAAAVEVARRHLSWSDVRADRELSDYRIALTRFRPPGL